MTIAEILREGTLMLAGSPSCTTDPSSARLDAEVLLAHVLETDRARLLAFDSNPVTKTSARQYLTLIKKRMQHAPVAYLIRSKAFYGRDFQVTRSTLIPRPETETLVEYAATWIKAAPDQTLLWDVGTGSGAIAISLAAQFPTLQGIATDKSRSALRIAQRNAQTHQVTSQLQFLQANLLNTNIYTVLNTSAQTYPRLLITANLPYLPDSDRNHLMKDVVDFEPKLALFSGEDGLDLIRRFCGQLKRHLPEWSFQSVCILIEFDPPQSKTIQILLDGIGRKFPKHQVTIQKDLAGRDRVGLLEVQY